MALINTISGYLGTAAIAVVTYVLAQFVGKQVQAYWETKKEIAKSLVLYANADVALLGPENARTLQARQLYRENASCLIGLLNAIPLYRLWAFLRLIPSIEAMEVARANLIGLSNSVGVPGQAVDNSRREANIRRALGIRGSG
jgi:hypothetical protein